MRSADLKSPDRVSLSFGSRVTRSRNAEGSPKPLQGSFPNSTSRPKDKLHDDPAAVAALFLGTPYLWGGNSRGHRLFGPCSGRLLACDIPCPGDSDQQRPTWATAPEGPYHAQ